MESNSKVFCQVRGHHLLQVTESKKKIEVNLAYCNSVSLLFRHLNWKATRGSVLILRATGVSCRHHRGPRSSAVQFGHGWRSLQKGLHVPSSVGMSNSAPFVFVSSAVTCSRCLKRCGSSCSQSKGNSEIGWMQDCEK